MQHIKRFRIASLSRIYVATLVCAINHVAAEPLKVATWNLQYFLAEPYISIASNKVIRRTTSDFAIYQSIITKIDADVFAMQEVGNEQALSVIAPAYESVISDQSNGLLPNKGNNIYNAILVHHRLKGKTLKKFTVPYSIINFSERATNGTIQNRVTRAFVGITLQLSNRQIVILSVHLKAGGCESGRLTKPSCRTYLQQLSALNRFLSDQFYIDWKVDSVWILGDFNRALQLDALGEEVLSQINGGHAQFSSIVIPRYSRTWCVTTPRSERKNRDERVFIDYLICASASKQFCNNHKFREHWYDESELALGAVLSDHCPISTVIE